MGGVWSVVSYFLSRIYQHSIEYPQKNFTFSSKSKAQLLLEYNDLDAVSAKYFYIQLLSEIKNAVLSDNVDTFKILSSLLNYVKASKGCEEMQKYEQAALEDVGKINLITLACKTASGNTLEYLLSNPNMNCILALQTDRNDLSPEEEDDESHNAIYYAIRSNVTSILEILIDKWPNSYFKDTQKLDDSLSKAFSELLVRNVLLTKDMELFVKKKLVDLRFFNDSSSEERHSSSEGESPDNRKDLLLVRIVFVLEKIDFIVTNYGDDKKELDEQFLLTAKYIAQNIHTLKSQLSFTYDKLPWEEMEFCFVFFIRFFYKAYSLGSWSIYKHESEYCGILNKRRLFSHLGNFYNRLYCVKEELKTIDIGKVPHKKFIRKEVIEKEENSVFQELYTDFTQMRDLHTLEKINKYTKIALSVDAREKIGHILITRALQVMGEHFNNTPTSPKLSESSADFLRSGLPKNMTDTVTRLRNLLSHLAAFCLRDEIEENANSLFAEVQADIAKINVAVVDVLIRRTYEAMLILMYSQHNGKEDDFRESIVEKSNLSLSSYTNVFTKLEKLNIKELLHLEKLVLNLEAELDKRIDYSKQMFRKLHHVMEASLCETPQHSPDAILRDAYIRSDLKELMRFLSHILRIADSTSLLTENEYFATEGRIDFEKVSNIMSNIFIKNCLTRNEAMLNRIKERNSSVMGKLFPQFEDLLQELLEKDEMADIFEPNEIKALKNLVSNIETFIESKSESDRERVRSLQSMIAEKKLTLKDSAKIRVEVNPRTGSMTSSTEGDIKVLKKNRYESPNATDFLWQKMDSESFMNEFLLVSNSITVEKTYLEYDAGGKSILEAVFDIWDFVRYRVGNIKWIKEFRHLLDHHRKVKPYTFTKKVYTLKPDFSQQLSLKVSRLRGVLKKLNLENLSGKKLQEYEKKFVLQVVVEMLVLDILSVAEGLPNQLTHINFYLDSYYPTVYGRILRNHLAHGNALVDMLLGDNFTNLLLNAQKIIEVENILQEELGKKVTNDPIKSRISHDMHFLIMKKQKRFFLALTEGIDEKKVKEFISEGVDIYGRDINSRTALHFAARVPDPRILKFLLSFKLDINAEDDNHQTPLHIAADLGRERIVEYLIEEKKATVDGKDIKGKTPLHLASIKGHEGVVKILTKHKANTFSKDELGYAPIHHAVLENHLNVVTLLLENETDVDANQAFYGATALHMAAAEGHLNIVNILLEKKANVNFKSDKDLVPLHYAANGGHFEVAKSLLDKGADVNPQTVHGLTPLHSGADNVPITALLLQHGAEVNATDLNGLTALDMAIGKGVFAACKLLMEAGAAIPLQSRNESVPPLQMSAFLGHYELVAELLKGSDTNSKIQAMQSAAFSGHLAVVELLFESGVDIKSLLDTTALHFAAEEGHADVVEFLLDKGADINAQDENGDTALHLSSSKVHKEVVELLIERKADILIKNKKSAFPLEIIVKNGMSNFLINKKVAIDFSYAYDESPLHIGALYGDTKFVNYCIQRGCPVDIRTKSGSTALHLATIACRPEVVSLLITNGSDIDAEDQNGDTALKHAINSNSKEILALLIKKETKLSDDKERNFFHYAVAQGYEDTLDFFLSRNANVGTHNSQISKFPLHEAVYFGHVSIAKKLLDKVKRDEINVRNENLETPLLIAAKRDHCEIAQLLLSKGANTEMSSKYGKLPLLLAIEKGSSKMVDILLKSGADYLKKDAEGKTPIELAIETKHSNIVALLLQNHDIYNIKGKKESSLLHMAASSGSLEIVETLIDTHADINCKDSSGAKPIHMAAKEGYRDILEYFLNLGIGLDEKGENDWTLLHYAADGNHSDICKFLSEKGADVNAIDADGSTPLHVAAELGNLETLNTLLEIGAFYDARDKNNKTPLEVTELRNTYIKTSLIFASNLFSSAESNDCSILEAILMTGLDVLKFNFVNVKNATNTAPIHNAARNGYERIVNFLLRNKANPNSRTKNDWTPLHYATKFSQYRIVKDLLYNGAVFEALSDSGKTPLYYSTDRDIVAILEFLKNIFHKIENKDSSSLDDLKAIEDMDVAKIVVRAKNLKYKTLTSVAMENDHPDMDELKEIFQTDVFIPIKMAEMFYRHGNYEQSFKLYEAVLQKRISIFDQNDPAVLDIQKILVSLLIQLRDYKRALSLAQKVYEILQSIFGDKNKETLAAKYLIALILENTGQEQKALQIYKEVSEKQRQVLGLNHKETLETLTNMAELLYKDNKFEMALTVNEEILQILTEDHEINPWILRIQTSIALIHRKQENYSEALELFKRISEAKEKIFGCHHQETMATTTEYAATLFSIGEEEKSLMLLRRNASLQLNLLGPNHLDTLRSRSIVADILFSQKKFREALSIYSENLLRGILKLGVHHPSIDIARKRIETINSYMRDPF
ncbi:unnamed protein product [Larinioides sclopetarius]|uniref:Alpha-latrotoxin n=1 Tax=Larinioides sclopetarius TaxID=280406 RepID=A0AAV2BUI7_9ARAC